MLLTFLASLYINKIILDKSVYVSQLIFYHCCIKLFKHGGCKASCCYFVYWGFKLYLYIFTYRTVWLSVIIRMPPGTWVPIRWSRIFGSRIVAKRGRKASSGRIEAPAAPGWAPAARTTAVRRPTPRWRITSSSGHCYRLTETTITKTYTIVRKKCHCGL